MILQALAALGVAFFSALIFFPIGIAVLIHSTISKGDIADTFDY